jgi:hypothetical protein
MKTEIQNLLQNYPDLLWILPLTSTVTSLFMVLTDRKASPTKTLFRTGVAVFGLINVARGLRLTQEISEQKKLNRILLDQLNYGDLGIRIREAIARYQATS